MSCGFIILNKRCFCQSKYNPSFFYLPLSYTYFLQFKHRKNATNMLMLNIEKSCSQQYPCYNHSTAWICWQKRIKTTKITILSIYCQTTNLLTYKPIFLFKHAHTSHKYKPYVPISICTSCIFLFQNPHTEPYITEHSHTNCIILF